MRIRLGLVASCLSAICLSTGTASAPGNYEVLHSLVEAAFPPMGRLHEASNGRLYGVARNAGGPRTSGLRRP